MMNSGSNSSDDPASNLCNEPAGLDLETRINKLSIESSIGVEDKTIDHASQPNMCTVNSGSILGEGSADKSQSGIPQEMMTVSSLTPNSSTSTLPTTDDDFWPPLPKVVSNPTSPSSQSRRTTDLPQFTNQTQQWKEKVIGHKVVQQPPTTHQMVQPLHTFQQNQNQNQSQIGTSRILIPAEGGQVTQGLVIGEGQRKPEEHTQGNTSAILSAPVGFLDPKEFSSDETWREYAFQQILQMKRIHLSVLLILHKKAVHLCSQETNMERAQKYENVKEFLEKMIVFLNIPTVDMIPKNNNRVYRYMNFVLKYLTSSRNKNGGSSQNIDQINIQPPDTQSKGPQLQPNNPVN